MTSAAGLSTGGVAHATQTPTVGNPCRSRRDQQKEVDFQDGIYIPTIEVLRGLRKEGFEPFMVAQGQSRVEGKAEFTKHMIRIRHAGHVSTRPEANEIILINSHDGASSYQMLAGVFRLCPAGDRRNYVRCRTMSRAAVDRPVKAVKQHWT